MKAPKAASKEYVDLKSLQLHGILFEIPRSRILNLNILV